MKNHSVSILLLILISLSFSYRQKYNQKPVPEGTDKWTGTLTFDETVIHSNSAANGTTKKHVDVSFTDALPTMYRDMENDTTNLHFTDDKGTGHYSVYGESTTIGGQKCTLDCQGSGEAELHAVVINEESKTYDIEAIGPVCNGEQTCSGEGTKHYGPDGDNEIIISEEPLGANKDLLTGSKTISVDIPGDLGTVKRTITWSLVRSKKNDVELIVIPKDYDNWLPEPGKNEMMKGSVMTIDLKLQGKNGKPIKAKVESFELRLSNTSIEPGITINYPLIPDAKQLPDLRFLLDPRIESADEDQFISISSINGTTGKAYIASYDGGGWATLSVEAILDDKRHIKGELLVSGGEVDILIPKRIPGTMISLAWANAHGNPQDMDDKETSKGNKNIGDGLTAYEEYRGVITRGKFKRLEPKKKELGIRVEKGEFPLFAEGLGWFKNASDVDTVIFNSQEIGFDGRLNKNYEHAHDYDQCVLLLKKGPLPSLVGGKAYTTTDNPAVPNQTLEVDVDVDQIHTSIYQYLIQMFGPLPYSSSDLIGATVAHELSHGVDVAHHGDTAEEQSPQKITTVDDYEIFDINGNAITTRPYVIRGPIGNKGSEASGDLTCVMAYNPYFKWAYKEENGKNFFHEVPIIPIGKQLCNSRVGTGINSPSANIKLINNYFSKAVVGNCMSQIRLR